MAVKYCDGLTIPSLGCRLVFIKTIVKIFIIRHWHSYVCILLINNTPYLVTTRQTKFVFFCFFKQGFSNNIFRVVKFILKIIIIVVSVNIKSKNTKFSFYLMNTFKTKNTLKFQNALILTIVNLNIYKYTLLTTTLKHDVLTLKQYIVIEQRQSRANLSAGYRSRGGLPTLT